MASGGLPGRLGGERPEQGPDDAAQPWGATLAPGAPGEALRTGRSAGGQQHPRGQGPQGGGGAVSPAGATAVPSDGGLAPGQAAEEAACRPAFAGAEVGSSPPALEGPALVRHRGGPADQAGLVADRHGWAWGRQGQTASLVSLHGGHQEEVASGAPWRPGCSPEGGEEQARPAEPPPPKPPRRLTPLSLGVEASRAAGRQEGAMGCEPQEDPAGGACQQGPPTGQAAVLIGSGGGAVGRATAAFGLPADSEGLVPAQEQTSHGASPEDAGLAAGEEASVAEQSAACPSTLSRGGLGLAGAQEEAGSHKEGEPGSPPWAALWPAECPGQASVQTAQELLGPGGAGAGARPPGALQESEGSPSMLFRGALQGEQQQQQLPRDCPSWERPQEPALGESGSLSRQEEGDGLGPASSWGEPAGGSGVQAPPPGPPHSQLSARGQRTGCSWVGEPALSPSCSGEGVMDFKRADFWQAARGGRSSSPCDSAELPGNPFASWTGPPAKNNPFVGEHPGGLPAPASACWASLAEGFRGLDAEAALPAPTPASQAQAQPLPLPASAPSLAAAPCPGGLGFPSPVVQLASSGGSARPTLALPQLSGVASAPAWPSEAWQPAEDGLLQQTTR